MAISERTRKLLWARAHDQCAFPGCVQALTDSVTHAESGEQRHLVLGEEAHIRGQGSRGPRHDSGFAGDVDGYDNLVLMCPTHHALIDKDGGSGFTVEDLLKIKVDHERRQKQRDRLHTTLRTYLGDRFEAENTVQFQQADLRGPSVDAMFVDVPVGCRRDASQVAALLSQIAAAAPGDTDELEAESGFVVTGATQALLHPDWSGSAVLIGGPGQGKSTVLQYVCQFHRARHLGEETYSGGQSGLAQVTTTVRFPIRVDLRKYAQWATTRGPQQSKRKGKPRRRPVPDDGFRGLEEYILVEVGRHIGAYVFRPRDFAKLVATEPVLLALDGLDEVASLATRARVTEEIAGMRARLSPDAADLMILVATRPGSSLQALTATSAFPVLHLQRLTQGLRLQYLQKWVVASRLSAGAADRLQRTFMDHQHVPHISELASYPMQLAILLHLLHRRQLLPQQRTELYSDYLKTFLDREQTEDKEPLLAEQRRVVEDTHAYLGWYLQADAEQQQTSGSITRDALRRLLRDHLADHSEEQQLADELYSAITDRVLCMVEREDAFEFEVQSLREYFAALYIFENLTARGQGTSRDDGLNALLERPYWANVCRFYIGMLTKGEIRAFKDNLRLVDRKVSPHPMMRAMAVMVLNDRIYEGHGDSAVQDIVNMIFEGPGVVLAEDGALDTSGTPLRLRERAGRVQAVGHLKGRLEVEEVPEIRAAAAASLAGHASDSDDVREWWWRQFAPTERWLRTAAVLGLLSALTQEDESKLVQALRELPSGASTLTELLVQGGYDGHDEEVLAVVRSDLNEGAAELRKPPEEESDLAVLVRGARFYFEMGRSTAGPLLAAPVARPRSGLARDVQVSSLALGQETPDPSAPAEWSRWLLPVARAWGRGWVLSRTVAATPHDLDLSTVAAIAQDPDLANAAQNEASVRSRRGDKDWWRAHLVDADGSYRRMLAVVQLLETAHSSVVADLGDELDRLVNGLTPHHYVVVEKVLRDGQSKRALDVQDALRLRRLELSGRTLWLVWLIGTDTTKSRVALQIQGKLDDVLRSGITDARQVVLTAYGSKKLKLEALAGTRHCLTPGGWADEERLATMQLPLARRVLEEPHSWPPDVVQIAIDRLTTQAARKTKPLQSLAAAKGWFGDE